MTAKRTYGDGCAAAHALDLVGERWALLVVRELMLGPQRFTDLQAGLPHISPNVLSQRLKDLEKIGVLRRYRLPYPAAVWVYELTDWGMELEPALQQLGRWGARSPQLPREAPISISTLVMGMRTMFYPPAAEGLKASYELRVGEERLRVRVEEGRLEVQRGSASEPNAILAGDTATLKGLIFAGQPLSAALRSRKLSISGNRRLAERFLRLFKMPEPVSPAGVG